MSKALYRDWLRRNEVLVQCLEGLVEHASWLLPDRFSSLEGPVELFRSLSGALSVFNSYMLANPAGFQGHFWLSLLSQVCSAGVFGTGQRPIEDLQPKLPGLHRIL